MTSDHSSPVRRLGPLTRTFTLTAPFAAVLVACSDPTQLSSPADRMPASAPLSAILAPRPSFYREAHFRDLAQKVPGFAGVYFGKEDGKLVIARTRDEGQAEALERVLARLERDGRRREDLLAKGVRFATVPFSYEQLARWRDLMADDAFENGGAAMVDLDEEQNRLVLGVRDGMPSTALRQIVTEAAIPERAVGYARAEPIRRVQSYYDGKSLVNRVRPLMGGLQTNHACTVSVMARWNEQNVALTAAHCSDVMSQVDGGIWTQPNTAAYLALGNEIADAPGWTCRPNAWTVKQCRHADLAVYSVTSDYLEAGESSVFALGRIARTVSRRHGPTTGNTPGNNAIDASNPYFAIAGTYQYPLQNEIIDKVGVATGWTYGAVYRTCADRDINVGNHRIVCTDAADTGANQGDSGGTAFIRLGYGPVPESVVYMGVVFGMETVGTGMVFSNVQQLGRELGTFSVVPQ